MHRDLHLVFEKGEKYYIGYCLEVPGANGQGRTKEECRQNLLEAIELMQQIRLEEALNGVPEDAEIETFALA